MNTMAMETDMEGFKDASTDAKLTQPGVAEATAPYSVFADRRIAVELAIASHRQSFLGIEKVVADAAVLYDYLTTGKMPAVSSKTSVFTNKGG